ncbi:MAG TPA: hypothetical protein DCM02_11315 [Flavobacterium sp.]|nr:hypothetical protein [Flavobacterium sp.]HAT81293.1 hypothetical protein [Flavobacterium sp.]
MTEKTKKYLVDIIISIELIDDFLGNTITFSDYERDFKTKSAVERQLIIIGEITNKIKNIEVIELSHSKEIINFRNRLVHAYDSIDDSIVWAIKINHLPQLKIEVEALLK